MPATVSSVSTGDIAHGQQPDEHGQKPSVHAVATQRLPAHAACVVAVVGQAAHAPAQKRKFALHAMEHVVPSHWAMPFGSVAQGVQDVPQLDVEEFPTQDVPQR
jgi:hypothetical protein